jgi:hypothetical protein
MDEGIEKKGRFSNAEEFLEQHQTARTAYRQEFRNPLNYSKNQSLNNTQTTPFLNIGLFKICTLLSAAIFFRLTILRFI